MKIHILTDNRTRKRGLLAEHGLSIFIEHEDMNILFDTGQTDVFRRNAPRMNVDLNKTDIIVLSHGHYDHCGGLVHFPASGAFPKVYIHEAVLKKKYRLNGDGKTMRDIGIPWTRAEYGNIEKSIVLTHARTQLSPDIIICGEIPFSTSFEGPPEGFYTGEDKTPDTMRDEQILVINTRDGLCVFSGCSHTGIANCLKLAMKQFPGKRINTLVAGMHLEGATSTRLQSTIQYIRELDIKRVIPLHCTGIFAISEMRRFLGNRCISLCAGDSL